MLSKEDRERFSDEGCEQDFTCPNCGSDLEDMGESKICWCCGFSKFEERRMQNVKS